MFTTSKSRIRSICLLFLLSMVSSCHNPRSATPEPTLKIVIEVDMEELAKDVSSEESADDVMEETIKVIERRIKYMATGRPVIKRQNASKNRLEITGVNNANEIKNILGLAKRLEIRLVDEQAPFEDAEKGKVRIGSEIFPLADQTGVMAVRTHGGVRGQNIIYARVILDDVTDEPAVMIQFDEEGSKKLEYFTAANVGKILAIILEKKIILTSRITEPILGESLQISGRFTTKEAGALASDISTGALPQKFKIVEVITEE